MSNIVMLDGLPVVTVAGKAFLYTEHRGIPFMVESEPTLRRTIRAINLLHRTGFDQMVRKSKMLTVIRDAPKRDLSALSTRGNAKIFVADSGLMTAWTLRWFASFFVHEAKHCEQHRRYNNVHSLKSRYQRERGACNFQKRFLCSAGGEKEARFIDELFEKKDYWWERTEQAQTEWDDWIAENDLIFDGLRKLGIIPK